MLREARRQTDLLFDLVRPDLLYARPLGERHRIVFYLGHLEAFDWNLIGRGHFRRAAFQADFDRLFAFGIDPGPGHLPADQPADWPPLHAVREYVLAVRSRLDALWDDAPQQLQHVAVEHRLMHAETLAYMLHNMAPEEKVAPPLIESVGPSSPHSQEMVAIPDGETVLGRSQGFGWDNEFPEQRVFVPAFRISRYKVTNADYLEFVAAGGTPSHFWCRREGRWYWRSMFRELPLPLDWPVWVTQRQASQYAAWRGWRLPSEAEWQRAAFGDTRFEYPWGSAAPSPEHGCFDFARWDPVAVGAVPKGDSVFGVAQMTGSGWEWTSSEFAPFPGFQPFSFYRGYSADFFDGEHFVLKGGSPRTAAPLLRRSFRNWFRADYPYVYAAFRCVEN